MNKFVAAIKGGRCANGLHLDAGQVTHAIPGGKYASFDRALCGTTPQGRSYGWSQAGDNVLTCERCLKAWRKKFLNGEL